MLKIYTVQEYAKKLKVTRIYVHQLIREKKLTAKKCGDLWLIIK